MKLNHFDEDGKSRHGRRYGKTGDLSQCRSKGKHKGKRRSVCGYSKRHLLKGRRAAVAATAGIMAAKKTWELIPMCHQIPIGSCKINFEKNDEAGEVTCTCTVRTVGKTGAEMEALTGATVALLTVYDMCKAVDKFMEITDIHLVKKTGGKSGDIINERYQDV